MRKLPPGSSTMFLVLAAATLPTGYSRDLEVDRPWNACSSLNAPLSLRALTVAVALATEHHSRRVKQSECQT